jgi:hypothetical protein
VSAHLVPSLRELYSRSPETRYRETRELQHVLFSHGYTNDLADEAEIVAAVEVARTDYDPERIAA